MRYIYFYIFIYIFLCKKVFLSKKIFNIKLFFHIKTFFLPIMYILQKTYSRKPLTIITKRSILEVAAVLDPSLISS